ncbi:MAG: OmpA family protein [Alphaproteobacteria bacterium]|nr:OmpA family protein [Alphaproteobacteria bacterium]
MNKNALLGLIAAVSLVVGACSCGCNVKQGAGSFAPGTAEDFEANVPNVVYFDFAKSNLLDSAKPRVDAQAAWLKTYTDAKAVVSGHTDVRGTAEYNMALGQARANTVVKALEDQGVDASRLTPVSFGKERPVNTDTTEKAHAENRRTVTSVSQNRNVS